MNLLMDDLSTELLQMIVMASRTMREAVFCSWVRGFLHVRFQDYTLAPVYAHLRAMSDEEALDAIGRFSMEERRIVEAPKKTKTRSKKC